MNTIWFRELGVSMLWYQYISKQILVFALLLQ
jgi:hypothetical protein